MFCCVTQKLSKSLAEKRGGGLFDHHLKHRVDIVSTRQKFYIVSFSLTTASAILAPSLNAYSKMAASPRLI